MSRLTYRDEHGTAKLFQETLRRNPHAFAEKLAHYEDLEEAGRLIELPCKVGDIVYKLTTKCDKHECPPISCEQCDFDEQFIGIRKFRFSHECIYLLERELGKTVFLTKAEAEARLEEIQKGGE